ncbi:MAG: hypothetical protein R8N23_18145 [Reichenbachiella sp.]|uniref:hypothetical protein n=1 Tax=Reichenbachiella sp. TaxID=2184521 RepID=UPI002966BC52|nr:hypothetical protein [Reichenbachiella sp.]MDW3211796.1 hypothetical protein [Reichenbachiella sp.]
MKQLFWTLLSKDLNLGVIISKSMASNQFRILGHVCTIMSVLTGTVYSIHQWLQLGSIKDPFFVGMIMANTLIIGQFLNYTIKFFDVEIENGNLKDHKTLLKNSRKDIFHLFPSILTGIGIALIFFFCTYLWADIWMEHSAIKFSHCTFLFASNLMTGIAIYCYVIYLKLSFKLSANVTIGLYDRSCPLALFLIRLNKFLTLAASLTCTIALLSLTNSVYQVNSVLYSFIGWIALVVISVFVIPLTGISRKVREIKTKNLQRLSKMIEEKYEELLLKISRNEKFDDVGDALKELSKTYKDVHRIKVFPPIASAKSYQTAIFALFVTLIPAILDALLKILN